MAKFLRDLRVLRGKKSVSEIISNFFDASWLIFFICVNQPAVPTPARQDGLVAAGRGRRNQCQKLFFSLDADFADFAEIKTC